MEVECKRVGAFDAFEPRRKIGGKHGQRCVGAIDMKPEILAMAEVGEAGEVVDGACIHGAGGTDGEEGRESCGAIFPNGLRQGVKVDFMTADGWDQAQCTAAEAAKIHGAGYASVNVGGSIGGELCTCAGNAAAADFCAQPGIARDHDGNDAGHGCAGDEKTCCGRGKLEDFTHPARHLTFHFDGYLVAATKIGVQAAGEHLRQHPYWCATAVNPTHEAGMGVADGEGKDGAHEFVVDLGERRRRNRNFAGKSGADCGGNGLPDGAVTDVLEIAEHIVEHGMGLAAKGGPVGGIEGVAGKDFGRHRESWRLTCVPHFHGNRHRAHLFGFRGSAEAACRRGREELRTASNGRLRLVQGSQYSRVEAWA